MAKKISRLDLCWKNCMSLWGWVAEQIKSGSEKTVDELKEEWATTHGFTKVLYYCFFCEYTMTPGEDFEDCNKCPAKKVDKEFECCGDADIHYSTDPIGFYNNLRALNRKRLKTRKK